jgi:hypothetical protein
MNTEISLSNLIWEAKKLTSKKDRLSEKEIESIVALIGKGCRSETKEKLRRRLSLPLSLFTNHGIYQRLILNSDSVEYNCGQSWNDEMRTLRECIMGVYL